VFCIVVGAAVLASGYAVRRGGGDADPAPARP
jgi:hypothetical protein